ncbi:MAG: FAD-binding oxidoreductase [Candidatus Zixiibacteriota bacterium]
MLNKSIVDAVAKFVGEGNMKLELDRVYAYPEDPETIPDLVKLAVKEKFKIIPVGAETKIKYDDILSGNELILSLSKLNHIKKVVPDDLYLIVEPGFLLKDLNKSLKSHNVFYPLALEDQKGTVGGSIACALEGKSKDQKILTKDFILGVKVILSNGEILDAGARVFKSVTGYDLPRLFLGSWGTLGIITEVSLRLHPLVRKGDYENVITFHPTRKSLDKSKDDPKSRLNTNLKKELDPQGIFMDL